MTQARSFIWHDRDSRSPLKYLTQASVRDNQLLAGPEQDEIAGQPMLTSAYSYSAVDLHQHLTCLRQHLRHREKQHETETDFTAPTSKPHDNVLLAAANFEPADTAGVPPASGRHGPQ